MENSEIEPAEPLNIAPEHRVEARWTRSVLAQGFTLLPALLINGQNRLGLTPEEFNVVVHLAYHWRTLGNDPYPTKRRIASLMGKSEKQVQRYFKSLEDKSLVLRVKRISKQRGQMSNSYDLSGLVIRLRELAAEDSAFQKLETRVR